MAHASSSCRDSTWPPSSAKPSSFAGPSTFTGLAVDGTEDKPAGRQSVQRTQCKVAIEGHPVFLLSATVHSFVTTCLTMRAIV